MAESEPAQEPWLTLAEAARRTGRHPDALRAMVRRGRLPGRKGNAGQWLVQVPARPESESGQPSDPDMAAQVAMLHEELAESRVAAARAEAERDAVQTVVADVRAALAVERERGDRLESALANMRRG
jgi:hypothetical protein